MGWMMLCSTFLSCSSRYSPLLEKEVSITASWTLNSNVTAYACVVHAINRHASRVGYCVPVLMWRCWLCLGRDPFRYDLIQCMPLTPCTWRIQALAKIHRYCNEADSREFLIKNLFNLLAGYIISYHTHRKLVQCLFNKANIQHSGLPQLLLFVAIIADPAHC